MRQPNSNAGAPRVHTSSNVDSPDQRAPPLHSTPSHAADHANDAAQPVDGPLGPTQSIVSVLNNPTQYSALKHLGLSKADAWMLVPPLLAAGTLPDVRLDDFSAFLKSTEREHQRYKAALQNEHDHKTASLLSDEHRPAQGEGLVQAMRQVPAMFFAEGFSLNRPETWQQVCPRDTETDRAAALEELLQLLDIVETYLLREISSRSDQFLEAAAAVQDLRTSLGRTHNTVQQLRAEVASLDDATCAAAVTVQGLQRRRANLEHLLSLAKSMDTVVQGQVALQLTLPEDGTSSADFGGALDVLDVLRAAVDSGDVAGIHAFRHLPEHVKETAAVVNEVMVTELVDRTRLHALPELWAALELWVHCGEGTEAQEAVKTFLTALHVTGDGNQPLDDTVRLLHPLLQVTQHRDEVVDVLLPVVTGVARTGQLQTALRELQDVAAGQLKDAVRQLLDHVLAQGGGSGGAAGAEQLQMLPDGTFVRVLSAIHTLTDLTLSHYAAVVRLLLDMLHALPQDGAAASVARCGDQTLQAVGEGAQARWAKLVTARAAGMPSASIDGLRSMVATSEAFIQMLEGRRVRVAPALKNAVQLHCRAVVEAMHDSLLKRLVTDMEQERWAAVPVPADVQHITDELCSGAEERLREGKRATPTSSVGGEAPGSSAVPVGLRIRHRTFPCVHVLCVLVLQLQQYSQLQEVAPACAPDVARRVVELLKVFNSRACQLVLGAGAMHSSGLRSITAKHLAMACAALDAVTALLQPHLETRFSNPVQQPQRALVLPEFDRVAQDLLVHRDEVLTKLVTIMQQRLEGSIGQLPAHAERWLMALQLPVLEGAKSSSTPSPKPSQFATATSKQLFVLRGVLMPLLQPEELSLVFGQVVSIYSTMLADAYDALQLQGSQAEGQGRSDMEHYIEAFRSLPVDPGLLEPKLLRLQRAYSIEVGLIDRGVGGCSHAGQAQAVRRRSSLDQRPAEHGVPDEAGVSHHASLSMVDAPQDGMGALGETQERTSDVEGVEAGLLGGSELLETGT